MQHETGTPQQSPASQPPVAAVTGGAADLPEPPAAVAQPQPIAYTTVVYGQTNTNGAGSKDPLRDLMVPGVAGSQTNDATSAAGAVHTRDTAQVSTGGVGPLEVGGLLNAGIGVVVGVFGAYAWARGKRNNWMLQAFFKSAVKRHVADYGKPEKGDYYITGCQESDSSVQNLIASLQPDSSSVGQSNAPILISGSKDVGLFLIAKRLAAELGLPLLKIDCAGLANSSGSLPESAVRSIAEIATKAKKKNGVSKVVLVLDGLEPLSCADQGAFLVKLKRELADPNSGLRKSAVVVGINRVEDEGMCHGDQAGALLGLKNTFKVQLTVAPPENTQGRADLLIARIESKIRYKTAFPNHKLNENDRKFLTALASAIPDVGIDKIVERLASAARENSLAKGRGITGEDFQDIVLSEALEEVRGHISEASSDSGRDRETRAVIFEAMAARSLGLGILAIGVQARGGESYVVREQLDAGRPNVGEIIKELVILGCIEKSYRDPENPTAISNSLDTKSIGELKRRKNSFIEMLENLNACPTSVAKIDQLAGELFDSLQSKLFSLDDCDVSLPSLMKGTPGPIELSNGELADLLGFCDSEGIKEAAEKALGFKLKRST